MIIVKLEYHFVLQEDTMMSKICRHDNGLGKALKADANCFDTPSDSRTIFIAMVTNY